MIAAPGLDRWPPIALIFEAAVTHFTQKKYRSCQCILVPKVIPEEDSSKRDKGCCRCECYEQVPLPLGITDDLLSGFLYFAMGLWFAGRNRTPRVFDYGVINIKFRRILEGCFRRLVLGLPAIRHGIRLFTAWLAIGDIHPHSIAFPVLEGDSMLIECRLAAIVE
jgi:hypothetical protein